MPSLGDFFRVDLPNSFIEPWDLWLQDRLRSVRMELNDQWNECFMSAPIWRFTLAAGLVGPNAMMGVLMPSVDRVGRQFPLTLAMPLFDVTDIPLSHFSATEQFQHLERLALGALEDGFTRDMLKARLVQIPRVQEVAQGRQHVNRTTVSIVGQDPVARLAAASVRSKSIASVWNAELEEDSPMLLASGLPTHGQMRGLFDLNAPVWTSQSEALL
jgi:type VI secretion system protein ImpM